MTEREAKKHALWPDFVEWCEDRDIDPDVDSFPAWKDFSWDDFWSCFLAGANASSEFRAAVDEGKGNA